uniref:Uncharacterized protein n=1 Tax=Arundo donax TaxID=35708 RepID=A0A0A9BR15_ARUDO
MPCMMPMTLLIWPNLKEASFLWIILHLHQQKTLLYAVASQSYLAFVVHRHVAGLRYR